MKSLKTLVLTAMLGLALPAQAQPKILDSKTIESNDKETGTQRQYNGIRIDDSIKSKTYSVLCVTETDPSMATQQTNCYADGLFGKEDGTVDGVYYGRIMPVGRGDDAVCGLSIPFKSIPEYAAEATRYGEEPRNVTSEFQDLSSRLVWIPHMEK